jgi:4'-phosphopantetheinyl transferase
VFSLRPHQLNDLQHSAYVWFCDTTTFAPEQIKACLRLLSNDESHRHAAIRSTPDADSYAISHALLREALSSFSGTGLSIAAPQEWLFTVEPSGKPLIEPSQNQPDLRFSLSHCRTACAIVITRSRDCGIDIEDYKRRVNYIKVAAKMFTGDEVELIRDYDDQREAFFRLWTLREARAKATGTGLANSASEFGFQLDDDDISYQPYNAADTEDDWQLATLEPLRDHILAVAIHRQGIGQKTDQDIHTIKVKA